LLLEYVYAYAYVLLLFVGECWLGTDPSVHLLSYHHPSTLKAEGHRALAGASTTTTNTTKATSMTASAAAAAATKRPRAQGKKEEGGGRKRPRVEEGGGEEGRQGHERELLARLLALPLEELPLEEALARVTALVEGGGE
jgi:hypothetical protein